MGGNEEGLGSHMSKQGEQEEEGREPRCGKPKQTLPEQFGKKKKYLAGVVGIISHSKPIGLGQA